MNCSQLPPFAYQHKHNIMECQHNNHILFKIYVMFELK